MAEDASTTAAVTELMTRLEASERDILRGELESLSRGAKVYQKRVGNSSIMFLSSAAAISKSLDAADHQEQKQQ